MFLLRHYRYEQKLASLLWKVDIRDVTLVYTDSSEEVKTGTKSIVGFVYLI